MSAAGTGTAQIKLDAIGIDAICERIENGETYTEIAQSIGCNVAQVHRWINSDDDRAQASARARTASAEQWLDRGLAPLRDALQKNGDIDASAARAYAQECARRAAIRNPQYGDSTTIRGDSKQPLAVTITEVQAKL